jgi:hypothetical protein
MGIPAFLLILCKQEGEKRKENVDNKSEEEDGGMNFALTLEDCTSFGGGWRRVGRQHKIKHMLVGTFGADDLQSRD